MSPVFNDKFDALMHLKRQETETGSNTISNTPPSTTAAPTTTSTPLTTSVPPTTTSAPPTSTSQPPTSSSTVPTTSSTTSSLVTSSTVPTSTSISTTSALPTTTTAVATTTPATTSAVSTTAPSSISRTAIIMSPSVIRTTSNGQLITVTAIVGATDTASTESSAGKPFFKNTGAVVGVFVVVGIIATALLFVIGTMFLRRRRAKQFDREVQEAAREAAHAQPPIDDDDDYAGGTSYNTHASQPMSTERPGGYGGYGAAASSWDPYGRAATGATGYEMQHRRTSTGTGPGMAGFATGDVFARNAAPEPQAYNQGYGQGYAQDSYNTGYGQAYGGNQQYNNQAYNTSPQQGYALAQPQTQAGRAPVQAQMMMPEAQRHSYNNVGAFRQSPSYGEAHPGEHVEYGHAVQQDEDPYGGYEAYDAGPSQNQNQGHASNPPAYAVGTGGTAGATGDRKGGHVARQPSASGRSGATRYSDDDDDAEPPRRVLKVANE